MNEVAVDWNEIWKSQMIKHIESNFGNNFASYYEDKKLANDYWMMTRAHENFVKDIMRIMGLTPSFKVLDIGSGPGNLAIPIAERVGHVTAVEPSDGMMSVLLDNARSYNINNIFCVHKRWEDVNINKDLQTPYAVVIASFSLGMIDIQNAIKKMVDVSSEYIYLFWFAGASSWDAHLQVLYPLLHGTTYYPMPYSDILFNVLYQMGIYPDVKVFPLEEIYRYSSFNEAIDTLSAQLKATSDYQKACLKNYISRFIDKENGSYIVKDYSLNMMIWWKKNTK